MSDELTELPEGWKWAKLSDVLSILSGEAFKKKDYSSSGVKLLQIANVSFSNVIWEQQNFLPTSFLADYPELVLEKNDIVMALNRPILNDLLKIARLSEEDAPAILYQRVARFNLFIDEMRDYFFCYTGSPKFLQLIRTNLQGSDQPYINTSTLPNFPIPIAPLNEQKRIVAKIEELRDRHQAAKQALEAVPELCDRFRQSVLAAAFRGDLTADWREENPDVEPASVLLERISSQRRDQWEQIEFERIRARGKEPSNDKWKEKYKELANPDTSEFPEIPDGWSWTTIGHIAECLDSKRIPVNKEERERRQGEVPYYGANGQVGWIDDYLFDEPLVIVVEDETFIGRTKPFCYRIDGKSWVNNHAHVLRPTAAVNVDFLNYSLMFYPFIPLTSGTTGRRKLTQAALMSAPYTLPPLDEQRQIVALLQKHFETLEKIQQTLNSDFDLISGLNQAILAKAFRGELVEQDPNDEPASMLLDRIRAEREAAQGSKTKKSTKGKQRKTSHKVDEQLEMPGME